MKTKQQIVEILKDEFRDACQDGFNNFEDSGSFDQWWASSDKAILTAIEQLEPEGDGLDHSLDEQYNKLLSEGKRLGVGQPSDSVEEEMNWENIDEEFMYEFVGYKKGTIWLKKLTRPTVSEGEIDALVTKLRADKTLGINEDKKKIIKAAIKELNR